MQPDEEGTAKSNKDDKRSMSNKESLLGSKESAGASKRRKRTLPFKQISKYTLYFLITLLVCAGLLYGLPLLLQEAMKHITS